MYESLGKCPSGDAAAEDAVVFAVVGTSEQKPLLRYFDKTIPISVIRETGISHVDIAHGMRISSNCLGGRCQHYEQGRASCGLAKGVREHVPVVVSKPPPCAIRKECVWWNQEGIAACLRCPTVTRHRTGSLSE